MINKEFIEYFENLSQSSLETTIKQLLDFFKNKKEANELYFHLIMQAGRINEINKDVDNNTVSYADAKIEKSKIRLSILNIIRKFIKLPEYDTSQLISYEKDFINDLKALQLNQNQIQNEGQNIIKQQLERISENQNSNTINYINVLGSNNFVGQDLDNTNINPQIKKYAEEELFNELPEVKKLILHNFKDFDIEVVKSISKVLQKISNKNAEIIEMTYRAIHDMKLNDAILLSETIEKKLYSLDEFKIEIKAIESFFKKGDLITKLKLTIPFLPFIYNEHNFDISTPVLKVLKESKEKIKKYD